MWSAILYLFLALFVFLIFTEIITINIFYDKFTVIEINFMVFALSLKFEKRKEKHKQKRKKKKRRDLFSIFALIIIFLKRSSLIIRNFKIYLNSTTPAQNAIRQGFYSSLLASFFAYAQENSKNFSANNIIMKFSEHNNSEFILDAQIEISLIDILISLMLYAAQTAKSIFYKKRGKKYV